jgi:hypothetical protein
VLRPEHGFLAGGEGAQRGISDGERFDKRAQGYRVGVDLVFDRDVGPVVVEVGERPRGDADRGGDLGVAAAQRVPAARSDELGPLEAQVGGRHGCDAAGDDSQPNGAALGVLRSGQQQLGDAVQRGAGAGEVHVGPSLVDIGSA